MMNEYYFKKTKSKGITYLTIWKRNSKEKDEYMLSLGTAESCLKKFVRAKELESKDKQFSEITDKLITTKRTNEKDKHEDHKDNLGVLEDDN